MDTKELLRRVRAIEIKTKGLTKEVFAGEYQTAFKGKGMAFSEVKDYQFGDDVRNIDWNVTARFDEPHIKVFEEERELSVMLIIDISGSSDFGTIYRSKKELSIEIAAVLGFSAASNNDKVGAIFITDQVEKYIPPKKGRSHVLMILRHLIGLEPASKKSDLKEGIKFFRNVTKKRSIAFVISDFISDYSFIDSLKIANKRHDMVALQVFDEAEVELPKLGLVEMFDSESGVKEWVNTNSAKVRKNYAQRFTDFREQLYTDFRKAGVDFAALGTDGKYLKSLNALFLRRGR